jgi:uncharacterized protein
MESINMEPYLFNTESKNEIVNRITNQFEVKDIILFGSYADGVPHADSDIDLLVILNENGIAQSYDELLNRKLQFAKLFRDLQRQIPIDILVYTKDEWDRLVALNSSFIKEVAQKGVHLI